ncbi:uncharacterized protein LOC134529384 isoform X13 [Bacillus rossius redtenbacheri]|uniref:uncharacterized protein LOC134529384 isoform X13 n=1 Tax=Bacillus rossius redtenbacheri TaxID=93214 RepID=UPI002FDEBF39
MPFQKLAASRQVLFPLGRFSATLVLCEQVLRTLSCMVSQSGVRVWKRGSNKGAVVEGKGKARACAARNRLRVVAVLVGEVNRTDASSPRRQQEAVGVVVGAHFEPLTQCTRIPISLCSRTLGFYIMSGAVCLLLCIHHFALGNVMVNPPDTGVLFKKEDPLLFSDSFYSTILNFGLLELENQRNRLEVALNHIIRVSIVHRIENNSWTENFVFVINQVEDNFNSYKLETRAITSSSPREHLRTKCSFFYIGGNIMKIVFGMLDYNDLINLVEHLKEVSSNQDEISSGVLNRVIFVQNLGERMINNTKLCEKPSRKIFI